MFKKKWTFVQKHTQQLRGDGKLSAVIGWKRLTTIQASMLLLSGSIMKNLSTFLQPYNRGRIRVEELPKSSWTSFSEMTEIRLSYSPHIQIHNFDRKNYQGTSRLPCEKIQHWYIHTNNQRYFSDADGVTRESFNMIIFTPSSKLTCEKMQVTFESKMIDFKMCNSFFFLSTLISS